VIIRIKNLRLRAIIGVNPWEKTEPQSLIINAELEFDGSRAAQSDKLEDTIDYRQISRKIIQHVESTQYELIEALAGNLLSISMEDARVQRARIEVDKPNAIRSADSTSVEVSGAR
jgi:D-erythro-7,8-dihydroneopterin triphosphate epimerase